MFSCFDRIPACDGQTDGQTGILRQHQRDRAMLRVIEQFAKSFKVARGYGNDILEKRVSYC